MQLHGKRQIHAEVVELVDTQDSGSCARKGVLVRVQSSAPKRNRASGKDALSVFWDHHGISIYAEF